MKTLLTLLAASVFSFAVIAQDKMGATKSDAKTTVAEKKSTETKYCCSACDYSSAKPGVCPHHKTALVQEGKYFCKGDEANASDQQGKCKDGTLMMKMDE